MSILKVARMGHPVLRARAKAIDPSDIKSATIQQLIEDMFQTMQEYNGVGLAAPQVHHSLRLFVAGFPPRPGDEDEDEDEEEDTNVPLMAIINPEITVIGEDVVEDWEGCLSIPDIRGRVPRAREIDVKAYDHRGRRITLRAQGPNHPIARILQPVIHLLQTTPTGKEAEGAPSAHLNQPFNFFSGGIVIGICRLEVKRR